MDSDFGLVKPALTMDGDGRRSGADRRVAHERRRSATGWFELRARRDGCQPDRRQSERRESAVSRPALLFWRRNKP